MICIPGGAETVDVTVVAGVCAGCCAHPRLRTTAAIVIAMTAADVKAGTAHCLVRRFGRSYERLVSEDATAPAGRATVRRDPVARL